MRWKWKWKGGDGKGKRRLHQARLEQTKEEESTIYYFKKIYLFDVKKLFNNNNIPNERC